MSAIVHPEAIGEMQFAAISIQRFILEACCAFALGCSVCVRSRSCCEASFGLLFYTHAAASVMAVEVSGDMMCFLA
eukprot:6490573-Amphidinium_carterae.2